jgi:two-component system sensor histidine kinase DesK
VSKKSLALFDVEDLVAIITWFIVACSALLLMWNDGTFSTFTLLITLTLFVIFIVSWQLGIRDKPFNHDLLVRFLLIGVQYLAILLIFFQVPFSYTAILVTIWSAQLTHYISIRLALLLSPLWSAPLWLVYGLYWDKSYVFLSAILFWTFNLFSLVMMNATLKEQRARAETEELNRELLATQALLSEATKQAERVRIARNIHDLLGHHLTALTINLQVASRISQGQAKEKIDQCHGLAKLLLSDVREAVSQIREHSNLQLEIALRALAENVPQLRIELDYDENLQITNVAIADTILRCVQECITNSLKHSSADTFSIKLSSNNNSVKLHINDNGQQLGQLTLGNGLTGMKERVQELNGTIEYVLDKAGFAANIELPEPI